MTRNPLCGIGAAFLSIVGVIYACSLFFTFLNPAAVFGDLLGNAVLFGTFGVIIMVPVFILVTIVIVTPLLLFLKHKKRNALGYYLCSGLSISAVMLACIFMHYEEGRAMAESGFSILVASVALAGPVAAYTYWKIVRPDRERI